MNTPEKEMIICSAIWYPDLELVRNDIPLTHFLPKNLDKGIVFCGHRHAQCMYSMVSLTGKRTCEVGEETQGFLTNLNRFVDRIEGAKIALESGQI